MKKMITLMFLGLFLCVGGLWFVFNFSPSSRWESETFPVEVDDLEPLPTAEPIPVAELPDVRSCKIVDDDDDLSGGMGFPRSDFSAPSTGTVKVTLLFVDYDNAPATMEPYEILDVVAESADIFSTISHGRVNVEFDIIDNWYRLSEAGDFYFPDESYELILEAVALADPDYDFGTTDVLYIMASDAINFDESFFQGEEDLFADGKNIFNVAVSSEDYAGDPDVHKIVAHELGHAFGLNDLYDLEDEDNPHQHVGEFDLMGNLWGTAPEFMVFHRWMLDWVDDEQIYCLEDNEVQVQLTPAEEEAGLKAVVVPLDEDRVIVVESRRALGYDEAIDEEGALVYLVDQEAEIGGIKVFPDEGELKGEAPLSEGETVTVEGVTVEVISADESGDVVLVTR